MTSYQTLRDISICYHQNDSFILPAFSIIILAYQQNTSKTLSSINHLVVEKSKHFDNLNDRIVTHRWLWVTVNLKSLFYISSVQYSCLTGKSRALFTLKYKSIILGIFSSQLNVSTYWQKDESKLPKAEHALDQTLYSLFDWFWRQYERKISDTK